MSVVAFAGPSRRRKTASAALTILEVLVVVVIIAALGAVAIPIGGFIKQKKNKQVALKNMRDLGAALSTYVNQNDNRLPAEDVKGNDTWRNAAKPDAQDAWYNALPRLIGRKGVGDYAPSPGDFYTKENILFLTGADYPESDKKLRDPLFAIAINARLQRKDQEGKKRTKVSDITNPAKTVIFFERGLPGEQTSLPVQTKKSYDGSPKGSAKSFVGRYRGQGIVQFLDGHAEAVAATDLLTETGGFPYPQTDVIWTRTPEENPNITDDNASAGS